MSNQEYKSQSKDGDRRLVKEFTKEEAACLTKQILEKNLQLMSKNLRITQELARKQMVI